MPKNLKPLVINLRHEQSAGSEFAWNKLQSPETFISGIVTPDIDIKSNEDISRLVSGIPSPFARPAMFKYAMSYDESGKTATPVEVFYKSLQDEWKGFVACLALDNQPITVEKVELVYSDGRTLAETANIYEPKGALGNMLGLQLHLWCDQAAQTDSTQRARPFINIVRYNGIVVGGTAPESLLFTAPNYDIKVKRTFYSDITKRFIDPLAASPGREDLERLFVYVKNIREKMEDYGREFSKKRPNTQFLAIFIDRWLEQIQAHTQRNGFAIDPNAIVPNLNKFDAPYKTVFNVKTTLFGWAGRISADRSALGLRDGDEPIEVELSELLLDPATATVAEVLLDDDSDVERLGVHLLRVPSDAGDKYFSLPLSEKGLAIFQDELEGLLQRAGGGKSRLTGFFDASSTTLRVTLQVDVNGSTTSFEKQYRDPTLIEGQKIICWPDFVSQIWNSYYLYSELPHNGADLKAFPLRADRKWFRLLTTGSGPTFHFQKLVVSGRKLEGDDTGSIIVEYDMNKIASTELKYEIYQSAQPFKGVELQVKNRSAGYVLFRSMTSGNKHALKDYREINNKLSAVRTGFDFGSNNICISYAEAGHQPELITFRNRRCFIIGVDVPHNDKAAAAPHEVFFFQNDETPSNHVKSMIMIHDSRRVTGYDIEATNALSEVIKGGLPVFEKNIPVESSAGNRYKVRFASQESFILYNMKWSDDAQENAYKASLLKSLWLKAYAELLELGKYPGWLAWAYPSAMETRRQKDYRTLWDDVGRLNPIGGEGQVFPNAIVAALPSSRAIDVPRSGITSNELKAQTEAFSVCKHALQYIQVDKRALMIGLDVGGSTTDILCLALKKDPHVSTEFPTTLIKEGSIKLAAGRLADATMKSPKFHQVLKSFCLKKKMFINGITVPPERLNGNTAPYYYNLIVDRLRSRSDLIEFYRSLASDCPDLFTLNAFMTGLIMFYTGQLAHRIRKTQEENAQDYQEPFSDITIGCFGKGGRMFDWLTALSSETATNYYYDCFFAGYGPGAAQHIKNFKIEPTNDKYVKAEVSFGLSGTLDVRSTNDAISELVGEDGFDYNGEPVDEIDPVEGRFFQHFGSQFSTPTDFPRFFAFAQIFRDFSKEYFGFSLPTLQQDICGMRLMTYVANLPEYRAAKLAQQASLSDSRIEQQEFDFVAPIIILEGMCFLETVLSPKLFGK